MPAHMLPKPRKGSARKMQQARRRLAQTTLAAASVLVRERDGNRCRVCGHPYAVELHHIVFRSQGGKHEPENLVCLCAHCHGLVHHRRLWLTGPASELVVSIKKPGAAA